MRKKARGNLIFVTLHTQMPFNHFHDFLGSFLPDTLDSLHIFLKLLKIDCTGIFGKPFRIPHKEGLKLLSGHLFDRAVGSSSQDTVDPIKPMYVTPYFKHPIQPATPTVLFSHYIFALLRYAAVPAVLFWD